MAEFLNAAAVILARGERLGDRTALIADGIPVSYAGLLRLVSKAANAITTLGAERGASVGLMLKDSALNCAAFLGTVRAGAVAIPMNPWLASADYAHMAAESGMRLVIADEEFMPALEQASAETAPRRHGLYRLYTREQFAGAVAQAGDVHETAATQAGDPAFWLFSSGTTGRPKGIIHSQAGLACSGKLLRETVRGDEHTRMLCTSKHFFAFGLENGLLGPLAIGGTAIINSGRPDAQAVAGQTELLHPDCLFTVPTFFRRLLALPPGQLAALRGVRHFYTGGERLPDALASQWRAATGADLHVCYGMSETYANASANFPGQIRAGSIGRPLANVETRLLDAGGLPVAAGQPGTLWLKHPSLALRYANPEATARAFRDGWFCTNDVCAMDHDGYLYHQGRTDELLKVAGQWVKPSDAEEAALGDARIREAACVVVPDRDGFERLALFVVCTPPGEGEAAARARVERLATHSRPKWVREVSDIPKTATGKIQRFRLREQLLEELDRL